MPAKKSQTLFDRLVKQGEAVVKAAEVIMAKSTMHRRSCSAEQSLAEQIIAKKTAMFEMFSALAKDPKKGAENFDFSRAISYQAEVKRLEEARVAARQLHVDLFGNEEGLTDLALIDIDMFPEVTETE